MADIWTDFDGEHYADHGRAGAMRAGFSAALPLIGLLVVYATGEAFGLRAAYPVMPFGLPAWSGVAVLGLTLPLWGLAHMLVTQHGREGRLAGRWIAGFVVLALVLPFGLASADMVLGSFLSMVVLLAGIVAAARTSAVSGRASLLLLPGLLWMGLGALVGFGMAAGGWSPPFALTDTEKY